MTDKMLYSITFFFVIFFLYYVYCKKFCSVSKIAIIQMTSHPSLDIASRGFAEVIKENFSEDKIKLVLYNCRGSLSNLENTVAQVVNDKDIKLFFTLGSLPTQSMYRIESERPILFAAVSDPYVLGIRHGKSNISGISDMTLPELPLDMINEILPSKQRIGLIYSYTNSNKNEIMQVKRKLEAGEKEVIDIVVQSEFELVSILEQYIDKIDILFSLCDNIVASSMRLITRICNEHNVPIMATFNAALYEGALATSGANYIENGREVGRMALNILNMNKRPFDYMIKINDDNKVYISKDVAMRFSVPLENFVNKENYIII